jgi:hypothetical protein
MGAYAGCNDRQDTSRPQSRIMKRTLFMVEQKSWTMPKLQTFSWLKYVA